MNKNNAFFDQNRIGWVKHKKGEMAKKQLWAYKLGGPNTKLCGSVPGRPIHSAAT